MARKKMTGKKLFLLYAYPCVKDACRDFLGKNYPKLNDKLRAKLDRIVENDEDPTAAFLAICFPVRVAQHLEYARANGLDPWAKKTVQMSWRYQHRNKGACSVFACAIVDHAKSTVSCKGKRFTTAEVMCGEKLLLVLNYYNLPLRNNLLVFVHQRVIIEIE